MESETKKIDAFGLEIWFCHKTLIFFSEMGFQRLATALPATKTPTHLRQPQVRGHAGGHKVHPAAGGEHQQEPVNGLQEHVLQLVPWAQAGHQEGVLLGRGQGGTGLGGERLVLS